MQAVASASAACNLAALIASDCVSADLAASLCEAQFATYLEWLPLDASTARYALEPVVNLARLRIRAGDGDGAWVLLEAVYRAVRTRTSTRVAGRLVCFECLVADEAASIEARRWLWTVLLADGTRALTSAGRWPEALRHVLDHGGVGERLLDGRQTAVVAHWAAGDVDRAVALIDDTMMVEPWEHAVAACLRLLCRPTAESASAAVESHLALRRVPEHDLFHLRLGMLVVRLARDVAPEEAAASADWLICDAVESADGRVARIAMEEARLKVRMSDGDRRALADSARSAMIGCAPPDLAALLTKIVVQAGTVLSRSLGAMACPV